MLHDIISDILVSRPDSAGGEAGGDLRTRSANSRTGSRNTMELEHWRMMAEHMGGVEKMGGRAGVMR